MKTKIRYVIQFLAFTLIFFILSRAGVSGLIYPFSFAMLFALAWANQKVWLLAPAYLVGSIINDYSFKGIICAVVTISLLVAPYYIHLSLKKPMNKIELFVFAFFSQTAWIIFSILDKLPIYLIILSPLAGLLFLFITLSIFEPLLKRGIAYKMTLPEIICGGIILMSFASGLDSCNIYGFSFLKLFVALFLLVISFVSSPGKTIIFASLMGLGSLVSSNNPIYMAPFIIWALAAISFKSLNRVFSALAMILSELLITLVFNLYYSFTIVGLLPVIIAAAIFLLIPGKFYNTLSLLLAGENERSAVKSLLNRNRDILQRRLNRLAEVFYDMNNVFRGLIKKEASEEEVKEMLYEELKSSICKNCPENRHCHRTFSQDTRNIFTNLISIALHRGKVTLLDFPSYLTSRCAQTGKLISEINLLTRQYKSYANLVGNVDTSKLLISDQLAGTANLMKTLASEVDSMISMDSAREKRLKDELSTNNIICNDAVVYERDATTYMATLVVREEDVNKLKLQSCLSKVCGCKMAICDVYPTEKAGFVSVSLKTAPRFDCIFGLAATAKSGSESSGDRHCIERLDGDRFIFAICDGMGSGEKAGQKAETAIGLIENFYKAGFDSDIILSSVNRLMNLERDDVFSSTDICVVDLKFGIADFIKMGAASSYIRGEDGCQVLQADSLPTGVLSEAKAVTKKVVIKEKDYIILCSDGINDSFGSDNEFKDFLLTIEGQNPQEFADKILERALSINNGYAVDDMTVLVVKIF